jgi:CRISPR-associated protein Cas1
VGKEVKQHFSADQVSHIFLHRKTSVTSDAMELAVNHQIPIVVINNLGQPVCRIWSNSYGSISTIRKQQAYFSDSEEAMLTIKELAIEKAESQKALLEKVQKERTTSGEELQATRDFLEKQLKGIQSLSHRHAGFKNQLRGFEGSISRSYFSIVGKLVPKEYQFQGRSRQPAQDMFNAALNYMYGILYSHVEGAIIKAGMDPYMGIMHRDEHNKPVLAYDLIEPYRVWADTIALRLCNKRLLRDEMFDVHQGAYWLGRAGKKIVIESFNDFMDTIIQRKHRRRNRFHHIESDIIDLAQYIKNSRFTPLEFHDEEEPL